MGFLYSDVVEVGGEACAVYIDDFEYPEIPGFWDESLIIDKHCCF